MYELHRRFALTWLGVGVRVRVRVVDTIRVRVRGRVRGRIRGRIRVRVRVRVSRAHDVAGAACTQTAGQAAAAHLG